MYSLNRQTIGRDEFLAQKEDILKRQADFFGLHFGNGNGYGSRICFSKRKSMTRTVKDEATGLEKLKTVFPFSNGFAEVAELLRVTDALAAEPHSIPVQDMDENKKEKKNTPPDMEAKINKGVKNLVNGLAAECDNYLTANGFYMHGGRKDKDLASLQNIVIDIDCHDKDPEYMAKGYDALLYWIRQDVLDGGELPVPNTLVSTGRGFQAWYAISGCSPKLKDYVKAVTEKLCGLWDGFLSGHAQTDGYRVDRAASKRTGGLFRMPGSYNLKTGSYGTFEIVDGDVRTIQELAYEAGLPDIRKKEKGKKKKKKEKSGRRNNLAVLGDARRSAIKKIISERRKHGKDEEGYRDLYCFVYFLACRLSGFNIKESMEKTSELNRGFAAPLDDGELKGYMGAAARKNYRLTDAKIVELLGLTKEEQLLTGISAANYEAECLRERKKLRADREKDVVKLRLQGHTQAQIATRLHCSQPTISRILNKHHIGGHDFVPSYWAELNSAQRDELAGKTADTEAGEPAGENGKGKNDKNENDGKNKKPPMGMGGSNGGDRYAKYRAISGGPKLEPFSQFVERVKQAMEEAGKILRPPIPLPARPPENRFNSRSA